MSNTTVVRHETQDSDKKTFAKCETEDPYQIYSGTETLKSSLVVEVPRDLILGTVAYSFSTSNNGDVSFSVFVRLENGEYEELKAESVVPSHLGSIIGSIESLRNIDGAVSLILKWSNPSWFSNPQLTYCVELFSVSEPWDLHVWNLQAEIRRLRTLVKQKGSGSTISSIIAHEKEISELKSHYEKKLLRLNAKLSALEKHRGKVKGLEKEIETLRLQSDDHIKAIDADIDELSFSITEAASLISDAASDVNLSKNSETSLLSRDSQGRFALGKVAAVSPKQVLVSRQREGIFRGKINKMRDAVRALKEEKEIQVLNLELAKEKILLLQRQLNQSASDLCAARCDNVELVRDRDNQKRLLDEKSEEAVWMKGYQEILQSDNKLLHEQVSKMGNLVVELENENTALATNRDVILDQLTSEAERARYLATQLASHQGQIQSQEAVGRDFALKAELHFLERMEAAEAEFRRRSEIYVSENGILKNQISSLEVEVGTLKAAKSRLEDALTSTQIQLARCQAERDRYANEKRNLNQRVMQKLEQAKIQVLNQSLSSVSSFDRSYSNISYRNFDSCDASKENISSNGEFEVVDKSILTHSLCSHKSDSRLSTTDSRSSPFTAPLSPCSVSGKSDGLSHMSDSAMSLSLNVSIS